jgi:NAD(P)-dependent dehydrogenase (short-subunit alcohol dehydrogenase family)
MSNVNKDKRIIIGASSAIGYEIAKHWLDKDYCVYGTYRKKSRNIENLQNLGMLSYYCDLSSSDSIASFIKRITIEIDDWTALTLLPATMKPLEFFDRCNFQDWKSSIEVNFINQMQIISALLPLKKEIDKGPLLILFSAGGVNNATVNTSAYTLSKIATIKMCELIHAELPNIRITAIGPGWVDTPIHNETLEKGEKLGANYFTTIKHYEENNFVPISRILEFIDWLEMQSASVISGRNFSVADDPIDNSEFINELSNDVDMYKLRRHKNNFLKN